MSSSKGFGIRTTLCGIMVAAGILVSAGCGDNLFPSGNDRRPTVAPGGSGSAVGQLAQGFAVQDTGGTTVTLASSLAGSKGAVFYFTMWCPICDTHMSNMRSSVVPLFPEVKFFLVDYVSGSVAGAASAASSNGYAGGVFTTLADVDHTLANNFQGTMGTTVVVDSTGVIRMNEDYRDGTRLQSVLSGLP